MIRSWRSGNFCNRIAPAEYRGQRYIVTCKDRDGKEMTVGWTDKCSGQPLVNSVNKHPSWHNPRISVMPKSVRK